MESRRKRTAFQSVRASKGEGERMDVQHDHDESGREKQQAHSPDVGHLHQAVRAVPLAKINRLRWALLITGSIMLVEVAGGLWTNSLALLSDAGHMFTHILALGMSYLAIVISTRPATPEKTFGYFRAEVLAALVNGLLLFIITGAIFYEAGTRIIEEQQIEPLGMLLVAVIGLVANGASVMLLFRVSSDDLNLKSAFVHVVYDTASSLAVVGTAIVIEFTDIHWLDSAVSVFIGILILVWAVRIVRESSHILLESTPKDVDLAQLREDVVSVPGVRSIHDIHIWAITANMYVMTAHIVVDDMSTMLATRLLEQINHYLWEHHKIGHTTLQFEHGVTPEQEQRTSPREWGDAQQGRDG